MVVHAYNSGLRQNCLGAVLHAQLCIRSCIQCLEDNGKYYFQILPNKDYIKSYYMALSKKQSRLKVAKEDIPPNKMEKRH